MKTNRWIETSRSVYARLLNLYPPAHRSEYGPAMLQLFVDQCRSAAEQRGGLGLVALWLRTLFDLGTSVLSEHLSAPGAKWGLLEALPDRPLPWKGVVLVLVPGLVLFASQVAQMTGENLWFFTALTWTPYLLMTAVLLVWLITRRYPVWGLMPLGLLCNNLVYYGTRLLGGQFDYYNTPLGLWQFGALLSNWLATLRALFVQMVHRGGDVWVVAALLLVPALLLAAYQGRNSLSRLTWILLGSYLLLSIIQVPLRMHNYVASTTQNSSFYDFVMNGGLPQMSAITPIAKAGIRFWTLYSSGVFLFLIFAGIRLARRYGDLAVLYPLGYVLGGVVYGFAYTDQDLLVYLVIAGVLLYRILLALVAPVWISRSAGRRRGWALAITIGLAFAAEIALHEIMLGYTAQMFQGGDALVTPFIRLAMIVDPLLFASGLALAINLYRQALPAGLLSKNPPTSLAETASE